MIFYKNECLNNISYKKIDPIKRLNLYFILVATFSCLMLSFIIIQWINIAILFSKIPNEGYDESNPKVVTSSALFVTLTFLFFILILAFLITNYVFIFMGINKTFEVYKRNEYNQKEFEKIKLFSILSIFTLGLVFPWIIIHKLKKLKNKY